jgi:hypothetical protein
MKTLMMLWKREWLEWRRVIIGTIVIVTFMNLLMLLSVSRGANWMHETLDEKGHITLEDIQIDNEEVGDVDIRVNGKDIEITIEGEDSNHSVDTWLQRSAMPVVMGMRIGMMATFGFVLFLSLFYFSDAIYKERADHSTLFYRSLPVSDHQILGSKISAGLLGVIGLTLFLSVEYVVFARLGIAIVGEPINTLAAQVLSKVSYLGIIWDWFSYLLYAAIRMAPLAIFLMLVGTFVKGRPLLIGIGGPILFSITWAILFQSGAFLKSLAKFFWGFNSVMFEQMESMAKGVVDGNLIYGGFLSYLFSLDTLISLLVSALLYSGMWMLYRKNIPTG